MLIAEKIENHTEDQGTNGRALFAIAQLAVFEESHVDSRVLVYLGTTVWARGLHDMLDSNRYCGVTVEDTSGFAIEFREDGSISYVAGPTTESRDERLERLEWDDYWFEPLEAGHVPTVEDATTHLTQALFDSPRLLYEL